MRSNGIQTGSIFAENQDAIKKGLLNRSHLISELKKSAAQTENYLSVENANRIGQHCSQYSKINGLVHTIFREESEGSNRIVGHEQFWKENEKMQRILQEQLRELKEIDITIDNIVNEEFDKCNEVDEIEETIRIILSKKQANHIQRAQPYYSEKEKCLEFLKRKKVQKQDIKQHKINLIKQILALLESLRKHRQAGLMYCLSKPEDKNQVALLTRAASDVRQMMKNKEQVQILKKEESDLLSYINDSQLKVQQISKQLLKIMDDQTLACQELNNLLKMKSEMEYFEKTFLNALGLGYDQNLSYLSQKLQKYERQLGDKEKQAVKIQQGIQTTNNTIQIFEHIFEKIESENGRRKNLMKSISSIKHRYSMQDKAKEEISEIQSDMDKLQIKKNKLTKMLESKVNQADVKTYKNIYSQIQKIEKEKLKREQHIKVMKKNINQNSKELYREIIELQEDYSDILSETVPNLWIEEEDFRNEQSIKDLNIFLNKTFKRLSITD